MKKNHFFSHLLALCLLLLLAAVPAPALAAGGTAISFNSTDMNKDPTGNHYILPLYVNGQKNKGSLDAIVPPSFSGTLTWRYSDAFGYHDILQFTPSGNHIDITPSKPGPENLEVTDGGTDYLGTKIWVTGIPDPSDIRLYHSSSVSSSSSCLNNGDIYLRKGEKKTLTIGYTRLSDDFFTYDKVDWQLSNTSCATLSSNSTNHGDPNVIEGTGKGAGNETSKLTITLTDTPNNKTCTLNFNIIVTNSLSTISIPNTPYDITLGGTLSIPATINPDISWEDLYWESEDTTQLTVTPGKVEGSTAYGSVSCPTTATPGQTVRIWARSRTNPNSVHDYANVRIVSYEPKELKVDPASCVMLEGYVGNPFTITAVRPEGADARVSCSSSYPSPVSIAQSSTGEYQSVTATGDGNATLTFTSIRDTNVYTESKVKVEPFKLKVEGGKSGITGTSNDLELHLNGSPTRISVDLPSYNNVYGINDVQWYKGTSSSTLTALETKGPTLSITAEQLRNDEGTAYLEARSGSKRIRFTVSVKPTPVTGIKLDDFILDKKLIPERVLNGTEDPVLTITPSNASNKAVKWKYDPENIIEVNPENGVYTAKIKDGVKIEGVTTVKLSAVSEDDPTKFAFCNVTVTDNAIFPTRITIEPESLTFDSAKEDDKYLKVTFYPANTTVKDVTWSLKEADSDAVTLKADENSPSATVHAAAPGKATVVATAKTKEGNTITAECPVTVSGVRITHPDEKTGAYVTGKVPSIGIGEEMKLDKLRIGGAEKYNNNWVWTSDKACVRVDASTGVVCGVSAGTANITVRHGDILDTVAVTVTNESDANAIKRTMTGNSFSLGGVLSGALPTAGSLSQTICGAALDYITGLSVSPEQGALYYGYHSEADTGAGVSGSEKFYPDAQGSLKVLERVVFVPKAGFTGTAEISFVGMSKNGTPNSYNGEIRITVPAARDISYTSENGEAIHFNGNDFTAYCKPVYGYEIASVRFPTPPPERYGYLYYDYAGGQVYASNISADRRYYTSPSAPALNNISFVPREGYTGTFTIPYNGWDTAGNAFSGNIRITVKRSDGTAGTGDIAYAAHCGQRLYFDAGDFVNLCKNATGGTLSYVQFGSLPASNEAGMYAGTKGTTALSTTTRYYNSASGYARLMDVNILPAANFTGTLTIPFTGTDTAGRSFTGSVIVTVTKNTGTAAEIYKTSSGMPVTFSRSDFANACKGVLPETLKSARFYLPNASAGTLYESFRGLHDNKPLAADRDLTAQELMNLVFVPKGSYSGSVYLSYTAKDTKGNECTGTARVAVWPADTSEYFNDVKSVPWAVSSIDFLKRYGVVTGSTETTFLPIQEMGRGDFVLMLSRAYDMPEAGRTSFNDVPAGSYYAEALAAAKHQGVATGDSAGNFNPAASVSRQDAAVFLYRAMQAAGKTVTGNSADLTRFPDGGNVSPYARDAMGALTSLGIFIGDGQGRLNPTSTLTRAEMAVILHRAIT